MTTLTPHPTQIPISVFKARLTEFLRVVEEGSEPIQITRHGKVVAEIQKPEAKEAPAVTMDSWIGGGRAARSSFLPIMIRTHLPSPMDNYLLDTCAWLDLRLTPEIVSGKTMAEVRAQSTLNLASISLFPGKRPQGNSS